jgi:hypothetical protein
MKKLISLVSRLVKSDRGDIIQKLVVAAMVLTAGVSAVRMIGTATEGQSENLGGLIGQLGHSSGPSR